MRESDLQLSDGRTLHIYDTGTGGVVVPLTVFWHHGTSNTGEPPEPLSAAALRDGTRWVSYDRPGYGGSTPRPGRDLGSAADDASEVADAPGIDNFAVMGHSGGANHALACAALLPRRILAGACMAASAPWPAEGLDWFAGMAPYGAAQLHASQRGRPALEDFLSTTEFDPEYFTPADHAAFAGPQSWLLTAAQRPTSPEGLRALDVTMQTHVADARSSARRCGHGDDIVEVTSQTVCGGVPGCHCPGQANIRERHLKPGRRAPQPARSERCSAAKSLARSPEWSICHRVVGQSRVGRPARTDRSGCGGLVPLHDRITPATCSARPADSWAR